MYNCSREFREETLHLYPILQTDRRYLGFFELILFSDWYCKTSNRQVIPYALIRSAIGMKPSKSRSDFNAGKFIEEFKQNVLPGLETTPWDGHPAIRGAREIVTSGISQEMLDLLLRELKLGREAIQVDFITGNPVTKTTKKAVAHKHLDAANKQVLMARSDASRRVIDYMNSLPVDGFDLLVKRNFDAALDACTTTRDLLILRGILTQSMPFYVPSKNRNTDRIFAFNNSITRLSNPVKSALTTGWTTFDLKCAHLAIASVQWGFTELADFLRDPQNDVWKELCAPFASLGLQKSLVKRAVKKAIYTIIYGGTMKRVNDNLYEMLQLPRVRNNRRKYFENFWKHWIVKGLYKLSKAALATIKKNRGATDCWGNWVEVVVSKERTKRRTARKVMATLSQAIELQLLLPVVELAEQQRGRNGFNITLWEHDGFSVHFYQRAESWTKRITDIVNTHCTALGVPTRLEVK